MNLYNSFKSCAFKFDPEKVHDLSIQLFENLPQMGHLMSPKTDKKHQLKKGHMLWKTPIGLAAGFDKNARALDFLSNLGFGSVEFGTVTPRAQVGNAKPRIKRFESELSLLNSMGFPNHGADAILRNVRSANLTKACPIGANLGKNKDTSDSNAPMDYATLYEKFAPEVDYLTINISSPNTPGLRALQSREGFFNIAAEISKKRKACPKPLFLKIAPELGTKDLEDLIDIATQFNLSGIIATNTSVSHERGQGGLSGEAIKEEARIARSRVLDATRSIQDFIVIGAGGISTFEDVLDFWKLGGDFVQIYTSFIYKGPGILKEFKEGINTLLQTTGAATLQEWKDSLK